MAQNATIPDDEAYQPKPNESKVWLEMIAEAEKVFSYYHTKADAIDKLYADLTRLASLARDREFQLFWSNMEVMKPSVYARPPVPVVVPRFKDRRPLYRVSSEFLERSVSVGFDLADINATMMEVRDDLCIVSRGSAWVRYETKSDSDSETEKVCVEHTNRRDFLHEPARTWNEVGWVAKRSWMTMEELKARFAKSSDGAYVQASTQVLRKDNQRGAATRQEKAGVWEIWSKTENKVVWVCEGVDVCLDEGEPHLKLQRFFPCPRPAYATKQRASLVPVPEMLLYKDQLEEINALTNRIHALSEAVKIKAFIPAGSDVGDAIQAAISLNDDRKIVVPVPNWAAFGGQGEVIHYLPIEVIANTIAGLVELRRAVIDDVYQIMGLSDIMRGTTEKDETLGAQQLKAQFGSVRIRDKQGEMARVGKECVEIAAEIMAEHFDKQTLMDMAQMDIPSQKDIGAQIKALEQRGAQIEVAMQRAKSDPQIMQQAQQEPQQAKQLIQQAQGELQQIGQQLEKLKQTVTIEQVMKFLRDNKIRPFVLDVETDSTIQPDEQAEKESRAEFVTALGNLVAQWGPIVQQQPEMIGMVGELIKFALAPYRVGRELEGKIDEAIEQMAARAQQPQPNPEVEKANAEQAAEQQRMQFEAQKLQDEREARMQEMQLKADIEGQKMQGEMQAKAMDQQTRQQESRAKLAQIAAQMERDERKGALEERELQIEIEAMQVDAVIRREAAQIDAAAKVQQASISASQAEMAASQSERSFEQQSALNEQKAKGQPE